MRRESGYYWVRLYDDSELEVMHYTKELNKWYAFSFDAGFDEVHAVLSERIEPPAPTKQPVTLGDVAKREALHRKVFGVVLSRDDLELKGYTQVQEGRVLRIKRNDIVLGEVML